MISMKKFEEGTPIVIAHRGGAELFTENTLTAFRKAEELGVDAIECDIHLTKDHHIVVMHDPDLKRAHFHFKHLQPYIRGCFTYLSNDCPGGHCWSCLGILCH